MRFIERVSDLNSVLNSLLEWQRTFFQTLLQRFAFEILHHEEIDALVVSHVIQDADVRMRQLRDGAGLTVEALLKLRVGSECVRKDLDRDRAIEASVAGAVDLSHAALSEERQ